MGIPLVTVQANGHAAQVVCAFCGRLASFLHGPRAQFAALDHAEWHKARIQARAMREAVA